MSSNRNPLDSTGDYESTGETGVYLIQADSVSAPLKVVFHPNVIENEVKAVVNILVNASQTMELTEPFNRIQKALNTIASEMSSDGK
jgi:hypothetical protein